MLARIIHIARSRDVDRNERTCGYARLLCVVTQVSREYLTSSYRRLYCTRDLSLSCIYIRAYFYRSSETAARMLLALHRFSNRSPTCYLRAISHRLLLKMRQIFLEISIRHEGKRHKRIKDAIVLDYDLNVIAAIKIALSINHLDFTKTFRNRFTHIIQMQKSSFDSDQFY